MVGQACVRGTPPKKLTGAAAEAAAEINKLLLHEFTVRVSNNPSTNLEELIQFKLKTYPPLRQLFVDSAVKAESTKSTETPSGPPPAVREEFLIPSDVVVIRPLSMDVTRAAQSVSTCASDSSEIPSTIRGLNDLVTMAFWIDRSTRPYPKPGYETRQLRRCGSSSNSGRHKMPKFASSYTRYSRCVATNRHYSELRLHVPRAGTTAGFNLEDIEPLPESVGPRAAKCHLQ